MLLTSLPLFNLFPESLSVSHAELFLRIFRKRGDVSKLKSLMYKVISD